MPLSEKHNTRVSLTFSAGGRATGFHTWAKGFEVNLFKRKMLFFCSVGAQTRLGKSSPELINLPSPQSLEF